MSKTFSVGDTVYVKFYFGGVLHPQFKYLPRVVTKTPGGNRKRYQIKTNNGFVTNRWACELFAKEEVVAIRLMD